MFDLFVLMSYKNNEKRLREDILYDSTLSQDIKIEKNVKLLLSYGLLFIDVSRVTLMTKIILDVACETFRT